MGKSDKNKIKGLRLVAEALGYSVLMRRVKAMGPEDAALTCPDIQKMYIDPKSGLDIVSTLAHEIGHVILSVLEPPGHRAAGDSDFDLRIAENAADLIGKAICETIGHTTDYPSVFEKAVVQVKAAKEWYDPEEIDAFYQGYCIALSDVLTSSHGAEGLAKLAREIREKAFSQDAKEETDGSKVQAHGLRFSRTIRSRGRLQR